MNDLVAAGGEATKTYRVSVVPRLRQEQDVDGSVATHFEQIVDFVGKRSDVDAAEDDVGCWWPGMTVESSWMINASASSTIATHERIANTAR